MPTVTGKTNSALKRLLVVLGTISIASLIVVACGGGESRQTSDAVPLASTQSERPQGSTPGQASGAIQLEILNGFSVPPAPNTTINRSTLAGIDINMNGARDDVERAIAAKALSKAEYENALKIAATYQRVLVSGLSSQADADSFMISIECAGIKTSDNLRRNTIQKMVLDTDQRLKAFRTNTKSFRGRIMTPAEDCRV